MKFVKLAGVVTAASLLLCSCSSDNKKLAMQIGDEEITVGAVKFVAQYGLNSATAQQAVDVIEQNYIINEIAEKDNIELSDEDKKQIRSAVASFKADMGGRTAAEKLLKEYGLKDDDILEGIFSASAYAEKVLDTLTVEEATDDEVKKYISENYLHAKHVLIATKDSQTGEEYGEDKLAEVEKTANEVLEKAKSGADFDELVKEYGEDPGMESNPGGYYFGANEMVAEFENATRSIQPDEITMCKSDFGYHIIKRLPIDEASEDFKTYYEGNADMVKGNVTKDKRIEALKKRAEELGIEITINQEVIDAITFDTDKDDK
ncbi:MAG: hypothetical protein HFE51_01695 [Clostridia bacterium]|nr:hypothetical protein [Clostridia bacterium]MCI9085116.1 hypothetical protein [Clostridia bacterium]